MKRHCIVYNGAERILDVEDAVATVMSGALFVLGGACGEVSMILAAGTWTLVKHETRP